MILTLARRERRFVPRENMCLKREDASGLMPIRVQTSNAVGRGVS